MSKDFLYGTKARSRTIEDFHARTKKVIYLALAPLAPCSMHWNLSELWKSWQSELRWRCYKNSKYHSSYMSCFSHCNGHLQWTHKRLSNIFTGSIARSATCLPVFNLLRGRFWGFSPRRGDTLHRWGWNLARRLHAKFHPHRCNDRSAGPQKLKFLLRFDRNVEYKRPAGAYPLRDF